MRSVLVGILKGFPGRDWAFRRIGNDRRSSFQPNHSVTLPIRT
jgi:hypothetical protein